MKRIQIDTRSALNSFGRAGLWLIGGGLVAGFIAGFAMPGAVAGASRGFDIHLNQLRVLSFIGSLSVPVVVAGFALLLIGRDHLHEVTILDSEAKPRVSSPAPAGAAPAAPATSTKTDWDRIKSGELKGFGSGMDRG